MLINHTYLYIDFIKYKASVLKKTKRYNNVVSLIMKACL